MTAENAARVRVSVVVPVYNPGAHIEALIDSLAAQTLPQDQFEVVFSDDGSTDDTRARLDRLAEERANVTVIHEPNSGWPGRPRNLGMDLAKGKYVFFVDQDDWLGVEALERMCRFAEENRSDVVIGRYAGHGRGVAKALFQKTQADATLANSGLIDSLTPHKMFRKAFLVEHDLRFPEGKRRLEDHLFVVRSYFLAQRISVLADYHCYFHVSRDDAGNAGFQQIDPIGYYSNVREVVDLVLANTEPGPVRDRCLRRTLRTELLGRLDGEAFLEQPAKHQRTLLAEARRIAVEAIPLTVDRGLPPAQRVRAALLRAGDLPGLVLCTRRFLDVGAVARLVDTAAAPDGGLTLSVQAVVQDRATGRPWRYDRDCDGLYLAAPEEFRGNYPRDAAECTKHTRAAKLNLVLRRSADSQEWSLASDSAVQTVDEPTGGVSLALSAKACLDSQQVAGGDPLGPGVWNIYARITQTGWAKEAALRDAGGRVTLVVSDGGASAIVGVPDEPDGSVAWQRRLRHGLRRLPYLTGFVRSARRSTRAIRDGVGRSPSS